MKSRIRGEKAIPNQKIHQSRITGENGARLQSLESACPFGVLAFQIFVRTIGGMTALAKGMKNHPMAHPGV